MAARKHRHTVDSLTAYADWWRDMARYWTELAVSRTGERAARLRRTASAALYAAWRADELRKVVATTPPRDSSN